MRSYTIFFFLPQIPVPVYGFEHLFLLFFMAVKASKHNSTLPFLRLRWLISWVSSQLGSVAYALISQSLISFPTESKHFQSQWNPVHFHFLLRDVHVFFKTPRVRAFNINSWCFCHLVLNSFFLISEFNCSGTLIFERILPIAFHHFFSLHVP